MAKKTKRERTRVVRLDGKPINLVKRRGHFMVCAKGCCCGRTDRGFNGVLYVPYGGYDGDGGTYYGSVVGFPVAILAALAIPTLIKHLEGRLFPRSRVFWPLLGALQLGLWAIAVRRLEQPPGIGTRPGDEFVSALDWAVVAELQVLLAQMGSVQLHVFGGKGILTVAHGSLRV